MAAPSVTAQNTRIDAADGTSSTATIGGGAGAGGEPDIIYQGSGGTPEDVSRKIGTSLAGFAITPTAADISTGSGTYQTLMMKYAAANFAALENISVPGIELRLGSAASAYALYDDNGKDTYPVKGGFVIRAIDPNISGYRTSTTGSPDFTAADYFAIAGDFTATSKSENLVLSAVDAGDGLTLIGGDGASTDAVWKDFADFDAGTLANRYGYFTALEGIEGLYGVFGMMVIGSATETDFTDSGVTTVFLDGYFAAGWSGVTVDLSNANSVFSNTNHTYDSRGNTTTTDTRATYTVTGTSGTGTETNPTFKSFASINLTSAMRFDGGTISDSGQIDANGADLRTVVVKSSTASAALLYDINADPDGELDDMVFESSGTGHAIELGSNCPSTITLRGHTYTGYAGTDGSTGNETIYNNSGKAITINVVGGGDTPTIRNGTGASTTVSASRTLTINLVDADGTAITDACEVTVVRDSDTTVLYNVENVTTGTTNYTYSTDAGTVVYINVLNVADFEAKTVNNYTLPTADTTLTIQLDDERFYNNP